MRNELLLEHGTCSQKWNAFSVVHRTRLQVYSCEYQLQVSDVVSSCLDDPDINSIPFWPPPDNANGGCNCNIGKISRAQVIVNEAVGSCDDFVDAFNMTPDQIKSIGNACLCCGLSGFLSP
jgi:hypothetical protein